MGPLRFCVHTEARKLVEHGRDRVECLFDPAVSESPGRRRCGAWSRDELHRLCKMAKNPPTQAEWNALYARLNRLIALYVDSGSEAGKLVRHLDAEMASLFIFLIEEGVDPTNNFGKRIVSLRQTCSLQGKSSSHIIMDAMHASFKDQQPDSEWIRSAT